VGSPGLAGWIAFGAGQPRWWMACQVQPAALALRYVRGHAGEIAAGAFPVRLGNDLGRDGGERPHRLPAPLFGEAAALGRRRSIAGQPPIPGPFPACGAALADRRLENEAGGERGGPELAGARAFQRLARSRPNASR
jgi:hypothetical protein